MEEVHITSLPDELLCMILQNNDYLDVVSLGLTCKHFKSLVNNHYIWKHKLKSLIPEDIFIYLEDNNAGHWFDNFKKFFQMKNQIHHEIMGMSAKYYNRLDDINLSDVRPFFDLALTDDTSYYYVINVLQDVVNNSNQAPPILGNQKYTLTELFYAKTALRYLFQTYLTVKWAQGHLRNELEPEVVLNFFIQWVDPLHLHTDEDIEDMIDTLVERVETLFSNEDLTDTLCIHEKIHQGLITPKMVLYAVSDVIYKQTQMAIANEANLDTLDIITVMNQRCANPIALAATYYAVAKKCGVCCDLVVFPHHFILEWRTSSEPGPRAEYKIVLDTGELVPKGRCPFSNNFSPSLKTCKYCPDAFLQYVVSAYLSTQVLIKDCYTQNSTQLLNFLSSNRSNRNENNPYRHFLPYLLNNTRVPAVQHPVDLRVMTDIHRDLIQALTCINPSPPPLCRDVVVRHRNSSVKYAVGMICYHTRYEYICVIRGWNLSCSEDHEFLDLTALRLGSKQPFYNIIAADQSVRYVAQENLNEMRRPARLIHLEDAIAMEFSHFDGFYYVPNNEKHNEYPEDGPIREMYRTRAEQRLNTGCVREYLPSPPLVD